MQEFVGYCKEKKKRFYTVITSLQIHYLQIYLLCATVIVPEDQMGRKGNRYKYKWEKFTHLRFEDDIVVIARTAVELQEMLADLQDQNEKVGLKINFDKTKIIVTKS